MKIKKENKRFSCIRFSLNQDDREIARAHLYLLKNDLHEEPLGYIEDVFVNEEFRKIMKDLIEEAKKQGCYKLVATSRHSRDNVHSLYENLGFVNFGLEFRMDI
jgi:hypothetical protein